MQRPLRHQFDHPPTTTKLHDGPGKRKRLMAKNKQPIWNALQGLNINRF
jgi:hypothetical protein